MYKKIMCLLLFFISLFSICFENTTYAEVNDKSVEAFEKMSDEYMKKVLEDYKVAGVTISVVKNGSVFFKKGYGYADVERKTPINPDTTDFHIASVSKLFTATAAMQLVEQGKLSLNEDVNNYLTDFKIKNPFSKPVTLEELLTHTSGFDDRTPLYVKTKGERYYDSIETLEEFLKRDMPPVVREPGTYVQYSVHGMALVGYLVQKVSGMPIDRYITDNILKPLDMKNSTYWLNKYMIGNMTKAYKFQNGQYLEQPYTILSDHPSGSICTTAGDMAKFMIMHLNNGEYNGIDILKNSTAKNMHQQHYPNEAKLTGFGLGFYETMRNGYKTIEHGGYLPGFSSKVTMLPEKNIGMFISINTDSKYSGNVCNEFTDKFYNFFTTKLENQEAKKLLKENIPLDIDVNKINGDYTFEGYGKTDLSKIKSLLSKVSIKCNKDGKLNFQGEGLNWNFKYVGNGLFYSEDNDYYCKVSEQNKKMVFSVIGYDCEKISTIDSILLRAALTGVIIFLFSIISLIVSIIKNRKSNDKLAFILKLFLCISCILVIMYFALTVVMALKCSMADTQIVFSAIMPLIKTVCYFLLVSTIISSIIIIKLWMTNKLRIRSKIFYSIIMFFIVINIIFMYIMNGFKL